MEVNICFGVFLLKNQVLWEKPNCLSLSRKGAAFAIIWIISVIYMIPFLTRDRDKQSEEKTTIRALLSCVSPFWICVMIAAETQPARVDL